MLMNNKANHCIYFSNVVLLENHKKHRNKESCLVAGNNNDEKIFILL